MLSWLSYLDSLLYELILILEFQTRKKKENWKYNYLKKLKKILIIRLFLKWATNPELISTYIHKFINEIFFKRQYYKLLFMVLLY